MRDNGYGHAIGLQEVGKRILKERDGSVAVGKDQQKRNRVKEVSTGMILCQLRLRLFDNDHLFCTLRLMTPERRIWDLMILSS